MTRYAWYSVAWPVTMRELSVRLHRLSLTEDALDGFVVDRVRDSQVDATYYRRVTVQSLSTDPFRRDVPAASYSYSQSRFVASTDPLGLELIDAPRGNQAFVSRMLEVCDFRLTILPLKVVVDEWANSLATMLNVPVHADIVQAGGIDLGGGSSARVTVRGVRDIRESAEKFISRPFIVEKMQIRPLGAYAGTTVVLTRAGSAKIQGRAENEVLEAARTSLAGLLASPSGG